MQAQGDEPLVDVSVDELVLALRLDHVVPLLSKAPDYAKHSQFWHLCELVTS